MLPFRETPQNGYAVIANGREAESGGVNPVRVPLQLDQLALAERSPVGGAIEDQQRALGSEHGSQRLLFTGLISGRERGHRVPDGRAGLVSRYRRTSEQDSSQKKMESSGRIADHIQLPTMPPADRRTPSPASALR